MLTPGKKGAIAETAFAAHATRLGFEVYRPVAEGGRFDLVLVAGRLPRVQCKTGRHEGDVVVSMLRTNRRIQGGYLTTTYTAAEVDAIAIYCMELDRCYLLPIALVEGRTCIHLRLAPSKNNQKMSIHWASDYELGAIAQLGERRAGSAKVVGSSPTSSTSEATASAVASLFEDPAGRDPPGDSSIPLRPSRRLPIIRAKCVPYCLSGASS
jgi:hypothetical protein